MKFTKNLRCKKQVNFFLKKLTLRFFLFFVNIFGFLLDRIYNNLSLLLVIFLINPYVFLFLFIFINLGDSLAYILLSFRFYSTSFFVNQSCVFTSSLFTKQCLLYMCQCKCANDQRPLTRLLNCHLNVIFIFVVIVCYIPQKYCIPKLNNLYCHFNCLLLISLSTVRKSFLFFY